MLLLAICVHIPEPTRDNHPPMRATLRAFAALLLLAGASPAAAQLLDPNPAGVRIGHMHLAVTDVEAQTRFWTEGMGGHAVQNGPLTLIELPGVYVMLRKVDTAVPPPEGSVVNHFGFVFKDLPPMLERSISTKLLFAGRAATFR